MVYIYMYNPFLVFTDGRYGLFLLHMHAIIPCICLHAAPCFYAFWDSNPYIFQQFTENVFTLG